MKVQKKPVIIDAMKWMGDNLVEMQEFTNRKVAIADNDETNSLYVITNEGQMRAKVGDMILKATSASIGEHVWPVDDGYFDENYTVISE